MCEYCGCRQIQPLAELMDEHLALLDIASDVEIAMRHRDHDRVREQLQTLNDLLDRHVRREEDGVFSALKETGEFLEEVGELEHEHADFHRDLADLDPTDAGFAETVAALFRHLSDHIDKEDLGIFPVSVVTLGSRGWDTVAAVHAAQPTFLAERAETHG